jgi:GNAT superfamily N-acetyltransferase
MNVAFRPADVSDFGYCERLYLAEMDYIIRALKLDPDTHVKSFRRQLVAAPVRIITLDGADVGWLQTTTDAGSYFLGQMFVEAPHQRRGIGTAVMNRLIAEASRAGQAMTLYVVKINPAKRLYERFGFRVAGEDEHKFLVRREPDVAASKSD